MENNNKTMGTLQKVWKYQKDDQNPLWHIILITSQPGFALSPYCCVLSGEATHTNLIVFGLTLRGPNPRSTASTLAIKPPMRSS
jgi:hypothetical protein